MKINYFLNHFYNKKYAVVSYLGSLVCMLVCNCADTTDVVTFL